jgi:uncharacterized protein
MTLFLVLIVLGVVSGILAGFFGIGGGLLFSPILFLLFTSMGVASPVVWTIGTSLFCTFVTAVSSSFQHRKQKNLWLKEGLLAGLSGAVGVWLGKQLVVSPYYTPDVFVSVFIILLFFVAVLFFRKSRSRLTLQTKAKQTGNVRWLSTGAAGGVVAALAGIGGGVVLVPILNLGYRISIKKAVSVSSMAIVIISLSGWFQFAFLADAPMSVSGYAVGFVDFGTSLPLVIGAFLGGMYGVKLNRKIRARQIQLGFSVLVMIIALMLIWRII